MLYHFTPISSNAKTGPIPVTTTSAESCPPSCPFMGAGCYAKSGPLALHWNKVTQGARGGTLEELCAAVVALPANQLWRHKQAGDLPGQADRIDPAALRALVAANVGRRGFTYTHKPVLSGKTAAANRKAIKAANARGFTVNLSANTLAHADQLAALEVGPVAAVVPQDTPDKFTTPGGLPGVVCPAQTRENINCAKCGLCARQDRRDLVIGFRPHGTGAKKADAVARG